MATNAFLSFFTLCMFHGASVPVHQPTALCLLLPSVFGFVSSDSLNMALNEHSGSMRTDFVLTFSATLIPNTQMQSPVCWWFCSLQTPPPHTPLHPWHGESGTPKARATGKGFMWGGKPICPEHPSPNAHTYAALQLSPSLLFKP